MLTHLNWLTAVSGLTAEVTGLTVDMTSQVSKDAFAASLNLSAASGQTDSISHWFNNKLFC